MVGDKVARWLEPRVVHAHPEAAPVVGHDSRPRCRRRSADRGLLRRALALTERARALVVADEPQDIEPWERLAVPHEVDGSHGTFRAPRSTCTLRANNDYEAVQAWLALHESAATERAFRKEAERLILWAIIERGRALSSQTIEDAVAYRTFLRHPAPWGRWVGPPRLRSSPEWRPFAGGLSARSVAYSLSVLRAFYRWLDPAALRAGRSVRRD